MLELSWVLPPPHPRRRGVGGHPQTPALRGCSVISQPGGAELGDPPEPPPCGAVLLSPIPEERSWGHPPNPRPVGLFCYRPSWRSGGQSPIPAPARWEASRDRQAVTL